MKVLLVSRLFSGIADSVANGRWDPSGAPAVCKLLEGLSRASDVTLSLVLQSRDADPRFSRTRAVTLSPLAVEARVLPWRQGLPNAVNELLQTMAIISMIRKLRPDVAYFTNAGFVAAGLAARLRLVPVVLRFLGIFPIHKQLATRRWSLARWFYRAPFARAVCSLDGSGGEHYLARLLRSDVPLSVLLNGVDRHVPEPAAVAALKRSLGLDARPVVVLLGRLERYKGAEEFVAALLRLEQLRPQAVQALVVGEGPLRQELEATVAASPLAGRVRFTGAVPHRDVTAHLAASDIYVSLNRYGGLSNANLEALACGCCLLMLDKDPSAHIDVATETVIPPEVAERLPREHTAEALAQALARLIDRPQETRARAARSRTLADQIVETWDARVVREIELIRGAAAGVTS